MTAPTPATPASPVAPSPVTAEQTVPQPTEAEIKASIEAIADQPLYTDEQLAEAAAELKNLTPEEYLIVKSLLDTAQGVAENGLPEAPVTMWANFYSEKGTKINVTLRGIHVRPVMEQMVSCIKWFGEDFGLTPFEPARTGVPAPTASATTAAPSAPGKPAAAKEVTYEPVEGKGGSFTCIQVEVTPVAGGKAKLAFYGNSHTQPVDKYPSIPANTLTIDRWLTILPPGWMAEHLAVVTKYSANLTVYWEYGRDKGKGDGSRWQNVVRIIENA